MVIKDLNESENWLIIQWYFLWGSVGSVKNVWPFTRLYSGYTFPVRWVCCIFVSCLWSNINKKTISLLLKFNHWLCQYWLKMFGQILITLDQDYCQIKDTLVNMSSSVVNKRDLNLSFIVSTWEFILKWT